MEKVEGLLLDSIKKDREKQEPVEEEMADILEVLFAICEGRGHTVEELMQVREAKREKRGGFKDRIYWVGNEGYNDTGKNTRNA